MSSQKENITVRTEEREGSLPSTKSEDVGITPETTAATSSSTPTNADASSKADEDKPTSKNRSAAKAKSSKGGRKKTKGRKKHGLGDERHSSSESDSDDGSAGDGSKSFTAADEDASTGSDAEEKHRASKKKRANKKHNHASKSGDHKKNDDNSSKGKQKRPRKSAKKKSSIPSDYTDSDSDSSSDDSRSENDDSGSGQSDGDDDDDARRGKPLGNKDLSRRVLQLQVQQQRLQHQLDQQYQRESSYNPPGGYIPPGFPLEPPIPVERPRPRPIYRNPRAPNDGGIAALDRDLLLQGRNPNQSGRPGSKKHAKQVRLEFKRVDQVWDSNIHQFKLQDTAQNANDKHYDEFLFHVRRTFDWEGKFKATIVDIKSKLLREALQDVIGNVKGISLVDDTPKMDPNMLFLYLEDLRKYLKRLKRTRSKGSSKKERKKEQKRIDEKRQHLKVLLKYVDKDYAKTQESLYPMLNNGLITFDLLWALWKPDTLAFTTTYSSPDEPRVFKVDMAEKHYSIMRGEFYFIDGKYFEYDGKQFGYGAISEEIPEFRGARKITSLPVYPLKYHKDEQEVRKKLIERGKKFVTLHGVHYKCHQGMAYFKKKKNVVKVNINGRVMIDPTIHRRINPNYPISVVRPKDHDVVSDDEDSDDDSSCCGCESDSDDSEGSEVEKKKKVQYVAKLFKDKNGKERFVYIPKSEADDFNGEKLEEVVSQGKEGDSSGEDDEDSSTVAKAAGQKMVPEFGDEEYLIASPVVLGFAFAEKLWLEFTVSGVKDIQWNEAAYESLVLEKKTKDIVKALVESHKYHPAKSIDDVIQGKGKGLVAVLHGPPGTGKTLTAEGISEFLKCPLYMVSAGELGTDSRYLEAELQKILDICHAWGAILLLDEADVFMEKRTIQDIHRNALVSIFLRQLEYFQGILFLTTNRVETFDDAFQSRIHIALRYDELEPRAKKTIFQIFIGRVHDLEAAGAKPFSDEDLSELARHPLNGRQIKNTVAAAQALAVMSGRPMSMEHIRQVLEVQMRFEQDLKGGTGYQDAMRSYF